MVRRYPIRWSVHRAAAVATVALATLGLAACGSSDADTAGATPASVVRLGYFPNITHAPGIAGVELGYHQEALGSDVRLETKTFNAGPQAVEALFSDALDVTFIGPNPTINAFQKSGGEGVRIIAGSTSGGAFLVVKPDIDDAADLEGKVLATPQLGNTQDVALRTWLKDQGLESDAQGGGDVSIRPQENAQTLETFKSGDIHGAWVPEPWATRLVQEGGAKVLVDEADLWPDGKFVTTQLVVRREFLESRPEVVKAILAAHVRSVEYVNANPADAKRVVNEAIGKLTGKALPTQVIDAAWPNLAFTVDPIADSLRKSAEDAEAAGLLQSVELDGIYELEPLNSVLASAGQPAVQN